VVVIAPNDALLEKVKSNMQEVRARGGELYVFADLDSHFTESEGVHVIRTPRHAGWLSPIVHAIPVQMLAYHTALRAWHRRGQAPQPRQERHRRVGLRRFLQSRRKRGPSGWHGCWPGLLRRNRSPPTDPAPLSREIACCSNSIAKGEIMSIIWAVIIGFIVGIVAKFLMPGRDPGGFIVTALLGIVGAVVATFLGQAMGIYAAGQAAGFIGSVIGAIVVLFIYNLIVRGRRPVV
jgi:uncharacterized membrane protein YeaQ/YmgE (transglycosylase-associated protein family)